MNCDEVSHGVGRNVGVKGGNNAHGVDADNSNVAIVDEGVVPTYGAESDVDTLSAIGIKRNRTCGPRGGVAQLGEEGVGKAVEGDSARGGGEYLIAGVVA